MKKALTIILSTTLLLSACGKKEEKMTDAEAQKFFATLEDARNQARQNAEINARLYRAESPRLENTRLVTHGDSTQSADCPQGDGWASVSFLGKKQEGTNEVEKYEVVCSTVSQSIGCFLKKDFQAKPYAAKEGKCDKSIPFPLPKFDK